MSKDCEGVRCLSVTPRATRRPPSWGSRPPRSTRSIWLHEAHGRGWAWRRVSPLLGAFRPESGLLSKPLRPCVTNGPTRLETGGFGIWYPTAATPAPPYYSCYLQPEQPKTAILYSHASSSVFTGLPTGHGTKQQFFATGHTTNSPRMGRESPLRPPETCVGKKNLFESVSLCVSERERERGKRERERERETETERERE